MEQARFDQLARTLARPESRRRVVGGLLAGAVALFGGRRTEAAACRAVGITCNQNANCCSGACGAKDSRGRRSCECPTESVLCVSTCCEAGWSCEKGQCVPPSACPPGYDYVNGSCFLICNNQQPGPGCNGLLGGVDGSPNTLCFGSILGTGCASTAQCSAGSACQPENGFCITPCFQL